MNRSNFPFSFLPRQAGRTVLAGVVALSLSVGCSKSPEQGGTGSLLSATAETSPVRELPILTYLPAGALGYYVADFSLASAKKYSDSPWSGNQSLISENVKKLVTEDKGDVNRMIALLEQLEKQGLVPSAASKGRLNSLMVSFALEEKAGAEPLPAVAVYEDFLAAEQVAAKIASVEKDLATKGVKTSPFAVDGGSGFSSEFTLSEADPEKGTSLVKVTLTVAAKGSRLVAATSPELINREFLNSEPSKSPRFAEIKGDPQYQRALAEVPAHKDEFSVTYLDTKRLLSTVARLSPEAKESADQINALPIGAGFGSREMNDALVDRGVVLLASDSQKPNPALDEIRKVSPKSFGEQFPSGLVGFVSIDGAIVRSLAKAAAEAAPKDPQTQPMIDKAMLIDEIGLALRPQQGASPLPELVIAIESPKADELAAMISGTITAGLGGQGFLSPFQKKEVKGVSVEYAMSPFGAGVYIASTPTQVLLSTSEGILTEVITGASEKKSLALEGLSSDSRQLLSGKDALGIVHVNYTRVSGLVQGLSSSLGIFTGGKPLVEESELKRIGSYGQTSASITVARDAIRFATRTEAVAESKN